MMIYSVEVELIAVGAPNKFCHTIISYKWECLVVHLVIAIIVFISLVWTWTQTVFVLFYSPFFSKISLP